MNSENESDFIYEINIDEFDLILELYRDELHIFEASTGNFLKVHKLKSRERVVHLISDRLSYLSWKGKKNRTFKVEVGVLELQHVIQTEDLYIFAIRYRPELGLGGHFGYYGWGLFNIENNMIHPRFSRSAERLRSGEIFQRKKNLIILLGFENGRIETFELESVADLPEFNPEPARLWEVTDEHVLRSTNLIGGMLLSTHNDGFIKVRDLESAEILHSIRVSKDKVNCLAYDERALYVGTWDGMGAAVDLNTWEVIWKSQLSDITVNGCMALEGKVCFVDNGYGVYWVERDTGEIIHKIQSKIGVASNPTRLKKWDVIAGAAYVMVYSGERRVEARDWDDDLIRAIQLIPYGVLVGNDSGKLSLWTYPRIKIREGS